MGDVAGPDAVPEPHAAEASEARWAALRRRIDRAIVRGLADPYFGGALLADPLTVLAAPDCSVEQCARLRAIEARTLKEFANQALVLFWPTWRQRPFEPAD